MTKKIRIAAVGDIAFLFKPETDIWKGMWDEADIRIANLEAPIVENPGPPADKLIRMKQPPDAATWLKDLNVTAVSLANNHMLDWGKEGLEQTCEFLDRAMIGHTGAGKNLEEASKPYIFQVDGHKIGFISWSSTVPPGFQALNNRPGIASVRVKSSFQVDSSILDEQPGTPPWVQTEPVEDDLKLLEESIAFLRKETDFVILALHWGVPPQWSSLPQDPIAEYQKVMAERVVDAGVDVILGHHSHAPYGIETYKPNSNVEKEVPVLYSLGNYIFHPEHSPHGFDQSTFHVPYAPSLLPENIQSCLAELILESEPDSNHLSLKQVIMHPAMLDEIGEPVEGTLEQRQKVSERLQQFSKKRGTETKLVNQTVVLEVNSTVAPYSK
ncbi:CapA family protein [Bacillus sp. V33-4]|uniref:CapA family protein n=1 Tax=Bacillus sp. V33-4 TaxID=2054169 RepID=UPI0015E0DCDC|nr:CapA family protein [Bacillus sp. V33-4]